MFQAIRRRIQDMRTLTRLCKGAEALANEEGRPKPGSEHFILAALALPDQTACQAFSRLGLTESRFRDAVAAQRVDALASVGVSFAPPSQPEATYEGKRRNPGCYEAEPSGALLVQRLAETRHMRADRCLVGADVLRAAAEESYTPSRRAFQRLGITSAQLAEVAGEAVKRTSV